MDLNCHTPLPPSGHALAFATDATPTKGDPRSPAKARTAHPALPPAWHCANAGALMKRLAVATSVAFSGSALALDRSRPLEAFNHLPPQAPHIVSTDADLNNRFDGKPFVCRQVETHTPVESDKAAGAFEAFVAYTRRGSLDEQFWMDETHRQRREALFKAAMAAGSWQAEYVDLV